MLLTIFSKGQPDPVNLQVDNMTSFRIRTSTTEAGQKQVEFFYTFIGESERSIILSPYEDIHKLDVVIRWCYDLKQPSLVVSSSFKETMNELRRKF